LVWVIVADQDILGMLRGEALGFALLRIAHGRAFAINDRPLHPEALVQYLTSGFKTVNRSHKKSRPRRYRTPKFNQGEGLEGGRVIVQKCCDYMLIHNQETEMGFRNSRPKAVLPIRESR